MIAKLILYLTISFTWELCFANGIKYPWLTQKPNLRQESDKLISGFNGLYTDIDAQNEFPEVTDDNVGLNEVPKINYPFAMMKYWALLNQKMNRDAIQPVIKRIPFHHENSFAPDSESDGSDDLFVELGEPAYQPDPPVLDRNVLETFRKLKGTRPETPKADSN
ncbi:uncharacterized protein LOC129600124 [Paramacrobiotus metropolitanus]|uniref:uncharacterized protein LOC129600124 n=1 Tax=Paramacrobiotus metropolitanus TaxID=2943436 RepID=UPI002445DF17|nr:uncharacterized protein LOC129600124 [Paramacrobiotus metropolitanus]XP_055354513.1 uncharacterized protein LOC129600124 [Paramacrobiotus metropolitanus]XP_055354522.1 uncharacterized protein LOC129600124 [Paramacrobiotus metropolitanus]XP_055354531.1 uncharacterized protein LOC129600124 [Paramacrobiotus metropolitanus]